MGNSVETCPEVIAHHIAPLGQFHHASIPPKRLLRHHQPFGILKPLPGLSRVLHALGYILGLPKSRIDKTRTVRRAKRHPCRFVVMVNPGAIIAPSLFPYTHFTQCPAIHRSSDRILSSPIGGGGRYAARA